MQMHLNQMQTHFDQIQMLFYNYVFLHSASDILLTYLVYLHSVIAGQNGQN